MTVKMKCPHCAAAIKAPESALGKKGKCPACKNELFIFSRRASVEKMLALMIIFGFILLWANIGLCFALSILFGVGTLLLALWRFVVRITLVGLHKAAPSVLLTVVFTFAYGVLLYDFFSRGLFTKEESGVIIVGTIAYPMLIVICCCVCPLPNETGKTISRRRYGLLVASGTTVLVWALACLLVGVLRIPTIRLFAPHIRAYARPVALKRPISANPYIRGRAIVIDEQYSTYKAGPLESADENGICKVPADRISEMHWLLPSSLRANRPDEVGTIVLLAWEASHEGYYDYAKNHPRFPQSPIAQPNLPKGYAQQCKVTVIDATIPSIICTRTFTTNPPSELPESYKGRLWSNNYIAPKPSKKVMEFLTALPKKQSG
ncbi:MAG: hypothetical protein AB1696_28840 [Planctomycetota bacterium]